MGTKNNPGDFDCYAHAKPDEPMFILLARDRRAPTLVRMWVAMSRLLGGTAEAKLQEALRCADAMEAYQAQLPLFTERRLREDEPTREVQPDALGHTWEESRHQVVNQVRTVDKCSRCGLFWGYNDPKGRQRVYTTMTGNWLQAGGIPPACKP